jgi:hypothetical protein
MAKKAEKEKATPTKKDPKSLPLHGVEKKKKKKRNKTKPINELLPTAAVKRDIINHLQEVLDNYNTLVDDAASTNITRIDHVRLEKGCTKELKTGLTHKLIQTVEESSRSTSELLHQNTFQQESFLMQFPVGDNKSALLTPYTRVKDVARIRRANQTYLGKKVRRAKRRVPVEESQEQAEEEDEATKKKKKASPSKKKNKNTKKNKSDE